MRADDPAARAAALIASLTSADLRPARELLASEPSLARSDLACACATGEVDDVERRLAQRPELVREPVGPYGWEPLLYACFSRLLRGDPERAPRIRDVALRLLRAGATADSYFINRDGWLQVGGALRCGGDCRGCGTDPDAARRRGDPTDERDGHHGNEVLYHACEMRDPTCARLVIEAGIRPELVDFNLGRALNFPNAEMVEMFCAHGARASADNLHQAVWRRRPPRTVTALLDAAAPVGAPDDDGLTPMRIAVRWGEREVADTLRRRGADGATVTEEDRRLGLYLSGDGETVPPSVEVATLDRMLVSAIEGGHLETSVRLLDAGARVDGDPSDEQTPLGNACWRRRVQIARVLVERGAALSFRQGGTALGATLHGSRHCHDPEGGPTMGLIDEIPSEPYADIVGLLSPPALGFRSASATTGSARRR